MKYNIAKTTCYNDDSLSPAVSVSFTDKTLYTIKSDVIYFSNKYNKITFNGILNRIIKNYNGKSSADFSSVQEEIKTVIEYIVSNSKEIHAKGKETTDNILNLYKSYFFMEKNKSVHDKSKVIVHRKFTLNKEEFSILKSKPELDKNNNDGYRRWSKYLYHLFEDYAALDLSKRERIILADFYNEIEAAIETHYILRAKLSSGRIYFVKPYKILFDHITRHNYIVCYSTNDPNGPYEVHSIRISKIAEIKMYEECEKLGTDEIEKIEEKLKKTSPSYISSEPTTIKVILSPTGQELYSSLVHNRPDYKEITDLDNRQKEYEFHCTAFHAKNYFIKFGKEAVIIEPEYARQNMKKELEATLANYADNSQ